MPRSTATGGLSAIPSNNQPLDANGQSRGASQQGPGGQTAAANGPTPTEPGDSLAKLRVRDGFRVELVAAEPLVQDPVAIEWGPDGKLWVAEMADYPRGGDGKMKPCGRIRFLEDTDGDSRYDKSTLFLSDVNFPNGVLPWHRGVLVTAAPEIFYAEDTDGDGKADVRKTLYGGFNPGNPQLRVNGLQWGLDGWVYCANGWSGGVIKSTTTGASIDIRGRDLRIRPDQGSLDAQAGVTEFGRNRNDWGQWFGCDNSNPLWHFVLEDNYTRRNPHFAPPDARRQLIAPANPKVFARSVPQKRYHSFEHSNGFTSACSAVVYRDEVLFPRHQQHAFVCEPVHNLVHHTILADAGVSFTAERDSQEQTSEFLASEDPWFRPVMVRTGPDGALWVVDMYRYMIEHPDFLPPEGQAELAPYFRLGEDRGRIYRVVRQGSTPRPVPRLDQLKGAALGQALDSPSGWQRDVVQQQLVWTRDPAALPALHELAAASKNPLARLHALCTLALLEQLTEEEAIRALADAHPGVRRQALRLAENHATPSPRLLGAAIHLVDDTDTKVILQLASSLGTWNDPQAAKALGRIAARADDDPYLLAAVLSSTNKDNIEPILSNVLADRRQPPRNILMVEQLVSLAASFDQPETVARGLSAIVSKQNHGPAIWQVQVVARLEQTLVAHGQTLDKLLKSVERDHEHLPEQLRSLRGFARETVGDSNADPAARAIAVQSLGYDATSRAGDLADIGKLLVPQVPGEVQSAAVARLAREKQPDVAALLVTNWKSLSPTLRSQVLAAIVSRAEWVGVLLDQVEQGQLLPHEIDAVTRQRLSSVDDETLRQRAEKLLEAGITADRREVVESYQDTLSLAGDAQRGATVFEKRCANCHRLRNQGFEVGPNLAALTDKKPRSLLVAILDPNSAVEARYRTYQAATVDGLSFSGILAAETGSSITLLGQEAKQQVILRKDLEILRASEKSLMPEGLEKDLSRQDLADVIEFLTAAAPLAQSAP